MMRYFLATLIMALSNLLAFSAIADDSSSWIHVVEPEPKSELWINPGMYSYHFQKDQNLNNNNWGVGLEYRFNSVASATVGNFKNSDNGHSSYVGVYYQPIAIGPIKLGVVAGGFNGYQSTNNGGWFPAVLPAITVEEGRFGANVFFIPTVGDRVHGAISLQLKVKIY
jgi:hypothetical protein